MRTARMESISRVTKPPKTTAQRQRASRRLVNKFNRQTSVGCSVKYKLNEKDRTGTTTSTAYVLHTAAVVCVDGNAIELTRVKVFFRV